MDVTKRHKASNPAESEKCYSSSRNRRIPVLGSIFLGGLFSHRPREEPCLGASPSAKAEICFRSGL